MPDSATTPRNEAAERLLEVVRTEATYTSDRRPEWAAGYRQAFGTMTNWLVEDLDAALSEERRLTVDAIRDRLPGYTDDLNVGEIQGYDFALCYFRAVLDEIGGSR